MSYLHFSYAKEIRRLLRLWPMGLTRARLLELCDIQPPNDRALGETLAELCHGRNTEVEMVRDPGTFTIYRLQREVPLETPVKVKAAPAGMGSARRVSLPKAAAEPKCACGVTLQYRGRGPRPKKCQACKAKALKAKVRRCPTCGHRLKAAA